MNGPTLKRKRLVASHYRRRPPLILVTNDDGIDAPGLIALVKAMKRLGDVVVVAPIREQSAVGHSITLRNDIHTKSHKYVGDLAGIQAVAIDGTPVDCAKLALSSLLTRRPDLTVSGINKGSNMAVNVMYSGTVSAATETSLHGIDSLAFSLVESPTGEYDFSAAALYAQALGMRVLHSRLPRGIVLNINVPAIPLNSIRGTLVTRLARSQWRETFVKQSGTTVNSVYRYRGEFLNLDTGHDTDVHAVTNGYVSISPIQPDRTSFGCLRVLETWNWNEYLTAPINQEAS